MKINRQLRTRRKNRLSTHTRRSPKNQRNNIKNWMKIKMMIVKIKIKTQKNLKTMIKKRTPTTKNQRRKRNQRRRLTFKFTKTSVLDLSQSGGITPAIPITMARSITFTMEKPLRTASLVRMFSCLMTSSQFSAPLCPSTTIRSNCSKRCLRASFQKLN